MNHQDWVCEAKGRKAEESDDEEEELREREWVNTD
jgi:hypothetical protein